MIELRITGENVQEFGEKAAGMIALLQAGLVKREEAAEPAPVVEKKRKKAEPAPEVAVEEVETPKQIPAAKPAPEPEVVEAEPVEEPKELTELDIQNATVKAVAVAGGSNDGAVKVIKEVFTPLGLKGVKSTPADRYPELHKALTDFIAKHEGA